jgi:hypothetical protein
VWVFQNGLDTNPILSKTSTRFVPFYEKFRLEQYEAVHEKGHCVVLAGPGSGKTKTLTTAMARALLEDVAEPRLFFGCPKGYPYAKSLKDSGSVVRRCMIGFLSIRNDAISLL